MFTNMFKRVKKGLIVSCFCISGILASGLLPVFAGEMDMLINKLSEKAGIIRVVNVKPGDTVMQNDILVEIE